MKEGMCLVGSEASSSAHMWTRILGGRLEIYRFGAGESEEVNGSIGYLGGWKGSGPGVGSQDDRDSILG